jgi:zinc transporter 1/2/3
LLGASFVHLMSDAEGEYINDATSHALVAVGFLISFILEKVIFSHDHDHGIGGDSHPHDHIVHIESENDSNDTEMVSMDHPPSSPSSIPLKLGVDVDSVNVDADGNADTDRDKDVSEFEVSMKNQQQHEDRLGHRALADENDHHHDHIIYHSKEGGHRRVPYMLFLVLALESAISGAALGVQTNYLKALATFLAIVTHIWAEAFTLCTAFLKAKVSDKNCVKIMFGFSLVTPAAILGGILVAEVLTPGLISIVSSVLISLAAGTFVYVACLEIIAEEFGNPHYKWQKLALLLGGFLFMAFLGIFL